VRGPVIPAFEPGCDGGYTRFEMRVDGMNYVVEFYNGMQGDYS
jgi:hypothetical protein